MIRGIPAAQYPDVRDRILPFLEEFARLSISRWTAAGLERAILRREKQVWVIGDFVAVCLTSLEPESVNLDFCAGSMRRAWQDAFDVEMKSWAKSLGKKRIIATVRPGWFKYGKSRGYAETYREMVLELGNG